MNAVCYVCEEELEDTEADGNRYLCEDCACSRCGKRPSYEGAGDHCMKCMDEETCCDQCGESCFEEDLNEFAGDLLCDDCYDSLSPLERLAECAE